MGEMYVISLFFYKSIKEFYVLSDILSKRMLFYQRGNFDTYSKRKKTFGGWV